MMRVPRPGGCADGRTEPSRIPSSGLALIIKPIQPRSRSRARTGSNIARAAPPERRATMTCSPRSLACGRKSTSGVSGLPSGAGHQVVVVDDEVYLGTGPPRASPQLLLGDVLAGHPRLQPFEKRGHTRCQRGGRYRIAAEVGGLDNAEQRPAKVDDLELHRVGGVGPDDLAAQQTQGRRLAALGFTQHDKMRLFGEIQDNWLQFALAETDGDLRCGAGAAYRGHCAVSDLQRAGARSKAHAPGPSVRGRRLAARPTGQRDHHLFPVARDTPSRRDVGQLAGTPAVHLGVGGIAQPQFDAGADLILQCRPYLRPAGCGDDDVHAV